MLWLEYCRPWLRSSELLDDVHGVHEVERELQIASHTFLGRVKARLSRVLDVRKAGRPRQRKLGSHLSVAMRKSPLVAR